MRAAGAAASSPPVISATVDARSGAAYTVAGTGKSSDLGLSVLNDKLDIPPAGKASVRVINAALSVPSADVGPVNGPVWAKGVQFGTETAYVDCPLGNWDLAVSSAGTSTTVPLTLQENSTYTVLLIDKGEGLEPQINRDSTGAGTVPSGGVETGLGGAAGPDLLPAAVAAARGAAARRPGRGAVPTGAPVDDEGPASTDVIDDGRPPAEPRPRRHVGFGVGVAVATGVVVAVVGAGTAVGGPGPAPCAGRGDRRGCSPRSTRCRPRSAARPAAAVLRAHRRCTCRPSTSTAPSSTSTSAPTACWCRRSTRTSRAGTARGAVPGEQGPAVIAGHVDSRSGPAVFFRLDELAPGDRVEVDPLGREGVRLPRRHRREPPQDRLPDRAGLRPDARLRAAADHLRGRVRPAQPPLPGQRRRHRGPGAVEHAAPARRSAARRLPWIPGTPTGRRGSRERRTRERRTGTTYLDHAATTPMLPEAVAVMAEALRAPATPRRCTPRAAGRAGSSRSPASGSPRRSARGRPRSCSPPAAPRATTSPSRASTGRAGPPTRAARACSSRRSSTTPCSSRPSGSPSTRARRSSCCPSTATGRVQPETLRAALAEAPERAGAGVGDVGEQRGRHGQPGPRAGRRRPRVRRAAAHRRRAGRRHPARRLRRVRRRTRSRSPATSSAARTARARCCSAAR